MSRPFERSLAQPETLEVRPSPNPRPIYASVAALGSDSFLPFKTSPCSDRYAPIHGLQGRDSRIGKGRSGASSFRPDQTRRASSLIGTEPALLARSRCWLGLLSRARGDADSVDPGRSRRLGQPPVFSLPSASSSYGPGRFSILHRPKLRATSAWSCPTVMSTKKPSVASTWPGASISG